MNLAAAAHRAGWAVADQCLSSLTNLVLSVAVARQVGATGFGGFALALGAYAVSLGVSQALCSEPLLVRASAAEREQQLEAARQSTGTALVVGAVAGSLLVVAGVAAHGTTRVALLAMGVVLPALLLQDAWRFVFLAMGRPRTAAANDGIWAVGHVVALTIALAAGAGVGGLVLAWGTAAAVAAVAGALQAGIVPAPTRTFVWLRSHRDLAPRFVAEFVARSGARQVTLVLVAVTTGLAALGGVRGVQVLFGPVTVLLVGLNLVAVPEAVRLARRSPAAMERVVRSAALGLAGVGVVAALASTLVPDRLGAELLGRTWPKAADLRIPQGVLLAAIGATSALLAGLRALAAARRTLRTRLLLVPLTVGAGVGGATVAGARGAILGLAAANWAGVAMLGRQLRQAVQEAERALTPAIAGTAPAAPAARGT